VHLLPPRPHELVAAVTNVVGKASGGLADLRLHPRDLIDRGSARSVYRYVPGPLEDPDDPVSGPVEWHGPEPADLVGAPVLLVPPLAAPALAFDLRRGCSYVGHLLAEHRDTYLVEYGDISFADRHLGIEHFVDEVVPAAIEAVVARAGGGPLHLVGWCLGGIFSLLTVAARQDLPVASVTAIASPMDVTRVPMIAPFRPVVNLVGRHALTATYRAIGGAPAPLVRRAFWATSLGKNITRPIATIRNLDDRDFLAQLEAVDRFTSNMLAYPGRTFGQLYHRMFRANDLADGHLDLGGRRIELARIEVPVLAVGGADDTIAPVDAVRHLLDLVPNAPATRFEVAPGGHLGVLTGREARTTTWPLVDGFLADHDPAVGAAVAEGSG
jgi:polyhydroxyalkanoate synthase subunit PhaC